MKAKIFKGIGAALFILLCIVFVTFMFLPVDSYIAKMSAKAGGYTVPEKYEDNIYRYYYNELDDESEKLAYRIIYASVKDFPNEIMVPKLTNEGLEEVFAALSYDNPELFFLGNKCTLTSIGNLYYFVPQYILPRDVYEKGMAEAKAQADVIIEEASKQTTDFEKELYVHDYLAENCAYADAGTDMMYTMYGLLVDGEANCEGYSRTAQYIFTALGIENHLITGTAPDENGNYQGHMWNIVKVDDEYYNLDITWDDYSLDNTVATPDNTASHIYFNMSTNDMLVTHSADDKALWDECNGESFGYFKSRGLLFDKYDNDTENGIKVALIDALNEGGTSLEIAFTNDEIYNSAFDKLTNATNGRMYSILAWANSKVSKDKKVDSNRIQYTKDDAKLVIRFFFSR